MAGTCHDEQVSALDVVIDPDFEPQKRPRSCTWPLPRPESNEGKRESTEADIPEEEDGTDDSVTNSTNNKLQDGFLEDKQTRKSGPVVPGGNVTATDKKHDEVPDSSQQQTAGSDTSTNGLVPQPRKSSARRNAWGNYSYADLITQAIESSPEKRLTLAQIYDWMVRSVPYFKDKGDSNSSAGWKNSIRHNLSLHSRFVRVQNEGTGKSSWWMVNPEGGKGGKAPRRRAVSMDNNSKYLKGARGRAAKKKATLQAAQDGSSESSSSLSKWTGSPTSRSSDELDAWTDFRSRTNSNASTISGRLSPILANLEIDEVPDDDSPLSPMLYSSPCSMSPSTGLTELPRLADLTGTMNLNDGLSDNLMDDFLDGISLTASQPHSPGLDQSGANQQGSPAFTFSNSLGAPSGSFSTNSMFSPTSITGLRQSPMQTIQENKQTTFSSSPHFTQPILQDLLGSGAHSHSDVMLTQTDPLMSQASASVSTQHSRRSALLLRSDPLLSNPAEPGLQKSSLAGWQANGGLALRNESNLPSLIKDHLQQSPIRNTPMQLDTSESFTRAQLTSQDRFSSDLDLDVFSGSLECDMDTIISHDVLDDSIELNFDSHLISSGNLNTGNFSNSKQTSSSNWVPG